MRSPTALTIRRYRCLGYQVDIVERWIPGGRPKALAADGKRPVGIRKDLFGIIDLVAIAVGEPLVGIQATSLANIPARVAKAKASPCLRTWLSTGAKFVIIGWAKRDGRWLPKVVELGGADLTAEVVVAIPRKIPKSRWSPADLFAGAE